MKVVLLAGGLGTRLAEETELKPKPMVEIGGQPVTDTDSLQAQLGPSRIGKATPAAVLRGGELKTVSVTVGERA